jgi:beta-glucanase (GH16 family)
MTQFHPHEADSPAARKAGNPIRSAHTILALAASALLASAAHADPIGGIGWNQVFNDDFNGTAVDETLWTYRTDVKSHSTQLPDNVSVADGVMNVALRQQTVGSTSFTGGGLVSRQRFRYGYYESRVRINDGAGWHTAFWLQAGDGSTTFPADQRTEIDGFEIESGSPTWLRHNILTWKGNGVAGSYYKSTNPYDIGLDLRDWHVYGIDWEENDVRFYVDNVLKADFAYSPSQWTHDFTAIWLTSIAYPSAPDATKLPSTVQFDYARYWQKDYYVDNDGPASVGYAETGSWLDSSLTGWTYGSKTRYAACGVAGATAIWRPTLASAGTYQVFVYDVVHSASDPATRYDVAGTTTVINGTTGSTGWKSLGAFALPAGTATAVQLTSSGTGCARADAVKFVRVS